jgi:hypothetical protein
MLEECAWNLSDGLLVLEALVNYRILGAFVNLCVSYGA